MTSSVEWPSMCEFWWNCSMPSLRISRATRALEAAAVCAPYQKMATMARTMAGRLAPQMPNEARASTGYGTPVFSPAQPIRFISTKMTSEPRPMASKKLVKLPHSRNRLAAR